MGILLAGSSKLYLNRSKSRLNISYSKCIDRSSKYASTGCARLGRLYAETGWKFHISKEGPKLFTFLTSKGREGLRFGRRIWAEQANIGRNRELLVVICKKWHVAKRLVVIPTFALLLVMSDACVGVMPTFKVLAVISFA